MPFAHRPVPDLMLPWALFVVSSREDCWAAGRRFAHFQDSRICAGWLPPSEPLAHPGTTASFPANWCPLPAWAVAWCGADGPTRRWCFSFSAAPLPVSNPYSCCVFESLFTDNFTKFKQMTFRCLVSKRVRRDPFSYFHNVLPSLCCFTN